MPRITKTKKEEPVVDTKKAPVIPHIASNKPIERAVTIEDVGEPDFKGSSVTVLILGGEHNGLRRIFSKEMHGEDWKKAAEAFRSRRGGVFIE